MTENAISKTEQISERSYHIIRLSMELNFAFVFFQPKKQTIPMRT